MLLLLALFACDGRRSFEEPLVLGGREVPPEVLNRGEFAYARYCRGCHGVRGAGDGPYARSLPVRPADLTSGTYPRLGPMPSDEAIGRLLRDGIEGTPMGPQGIGDEDLRALVQYVKTLAPVWRGAQEVQ